MKISYIDKCRYRKEYYNNYAYYPVLTAIFFILSLASSTVAQRYASSHADICITLLYSVSAILSIFCLKQLRDEYKNEQTFNVMTLLYACLYPAAAFLLHHLLMN